MSVFPPADPAPLSQVTVTQTTRQKLILLFVTGLLFWSNITSLLPTIPVYIQSFGATSQEVGLVMGAFAIGLLCSRPTLGKWTDQRGRLLVLRIGIVVAIIAPLLYGLADSIGLLFAVRIFHGISIAAFTTAYSALVTDLAPPQRRGELIGYMSLITPISLGFGPVLGSSLQTHWGFNWLFWCSAGLGLMSLLLSRGLTEPSWQRRSRSEPTIENEILSTDRIEADPLKPDFLRTDRIKTDHPEKPDLALKPQRSSQPAYDRRFWRLILEPRLFVPSVTLSLVGIIFGTIVTFMPLFIQASQIPLNVGLFYSAAAIASFCARPLVGKFSDQLGRGPFICIALLAYTIAMALLSQATTPQTVLIAGFFEGMGAGTVLPCVLALVSDRAQPQERGRLFAICISGFDLGVAVAGPLLGLLSDWLGYRPLFALCSFNAAIALLFFMTKNSKTLRHSYRYALGREADLYALD